MALNHEITGSNPVLPAYMAGDYTYDCDVAGDFEWFQGKEIISFKGTPVYECYFHGGHVE